VTALYVLLGLTFLQASVAMYQSKAPALWRAFVMHALTWWAVATV
jgi:hypothetical protein